MVGSASVTAFASDNAPPASTEVKSLIKAGLPIFDAKPADLNVPDKAVSPAPATPEAATTPGVVRMDPYVMLDKRPLTEDAVMTDRSWAEFAMDKYLGGLDQFDRGFLNAYTLPELWAKIPVIGRLPFSGPAGTLTNEERAMRLLRLDQKADILKEQKDFEVLGRSESSGAPK
jgi:hypothetical protein